MNTFKQSTLADFDVLTMVRKELLPLLEPVPAEGEGGVVGASSASDVQCTYLDYMGCTPFVEVSELAKVLSSHQRQTSGGAAVNIAPIMSLSPSLNVNNRLFGNPHSTHRHGLSSGAAMRELRQRTIEYCFPASTSPKRNGGSPSEFVCVFTAGASAGLKLVSELLGSLGGIAHHASLSSPRSRSDAGVTAQSDSFIVDSFIPHRLSHNSVLGMRGPLLRRSHLSLRGERTFYNTFLSREDITAHFEQIRQRDLEQSSLAHTSIISSDPLSPRPRIPITVVAFPAECNLSGTVLDVTQTAAMIRGAFAEVMGKRDATGEGHRQVQRRLVIVCDGAAAVGKHPIDLSSSSAVDYFVFSYYKAFGGPTGLGALLVSLRDSNAPSLHCADETDEANTTHSSYSPHSQASVCSSSSSFVTPLAFLQYGKAFGGGYFGGGAVSFVLPSTLSEGIKGLEEVGVGSRGSADGPRACALSPSPLFTPCSVVTTAAVSVGKSRLPNALFSSSPYSSAPASPSSFAAPLDREAACQGLEDGTPHFLGIATALQWMRLVALFPSILSPIAVGRRIATLRRYAVSRLRRLVFPMTKQRRRAIVLVNPQDEKLDMAVDDGDAHVDASSSCGERGLSLGSSIPFRVLTAGGAIEAHSVVESLLANNAHYPIALRAGGFCNPGACQVFMDVTEDDIRETFGGAREEEEEGHALDKNNGGGGSSNNKGSNAANSVRPMRSQCFDANDSTPVGGKMLGCLRISFGLYSTMADVDRLIAALVAMGFEEATVDGEEAEHKGEDTQHCDKAFFRSSSKITPSAVRVADEKAPQYGDDGVSLPLSSPSPSSSPRPTYRLHSLYVYPIKGCGAIVPRRCWPLTHSGLLFDRQWCLMIDSGVGGGEGTAEKGSGGRALAPKDCIALAGMVPSILFRSGDDKDNTFHVLGEESGGGGDVSFDFERILSQPSTTFYLRIYLPQTSVTLTIPISASSTSITNVNASLTANADAQGEAKDSVVEGRSDTISVRRHTVDGVRAQSIDMAGIDISVALSLELGLDNVQLVMASSMKGGGKKGAKKGGGGEVGDVRSTTKDFASSAEVANGYSTSLANFSNSGELLLITTESHTMILDAIPNKEGDAAHVTLLSYRPNIVVEGEENARRVEGQLVTTEFSHQQHYDGIAQGEAYRPYSELFWSSAQILRRKSPSKIDAEEKANELITTLQKRELCLRCSQVGVDTSSMRILQQPLAAIRATCQSLMASLTDEACEAIGATRNSIAFGTIFSPSQRRDDSAQFCVLQLGDIVVPETTQLDTAMKI